MCRAYAELSTCRQVGFSLGPVPWLAMIEWADYHGLARDVADHLVHVLRLVDAETLRRARTQDPPKKTPPP